MGHASVLVVGMLSLQPSRNLLRRPIALKLAGYCPADLPPENCAIILVDV
jgi:hypothetical protein